jgi:hypothetical protein
MTELDAVLNVIEKALKKNLTVSIAHVPSLNNPTGKPSSEIETFALANNIEMAWYLLEEVGKDTPLRARQVIATEKAVSVKFDRMPKVQGHNYVLMNSENTGTINSQVKDQRNNFTKMIGKDPAAILERDSEELTVVLNPYWTADPWNVDASSARRKRQRVRVE